MSALDRYQEMLVVAPKVVLRPLPVDDLLLLAEQVAVTGICRCADFLGSWYDSHDLHATARRMVIYHLSTLVSGDANAWRLPLGVYVDTPDGQVPIGAQGLSAEEFYSSRAVTSGSWLLPEWQGRGFGVAMRLAIAHVAFVEIGASVLNSSAVKGNVVSIGVSKRCGYVEVGEGIIDDGERKELIYLALHKDAFVANGIISSGFDQWRADRRLSRPA